jgi:hypothetical protein
MLNRSSTHAAPRMAKCSKRNVAETEKAAMPVVTSTARSSKGGTSMKTCKLLEDIATDSHEKCHNLWRPRPSAKAVVPRRSISRPSRQDKFLRRYFLLFLESQYATLVCGYSPHLNPHLKLLPTTFYAIVSDPKHHIPTYPEQLGSALMLLKGTLKIECGFSRIVIACFLVILGKKFKSTADVDPNRIDPGPSAWISRLEAGPITYNLILNRMGEYRW